MSTGHYHRRWSSSTTGRTTPTSFSTLSSAIEPSTYGTSWNSVRWNKSTPGYRSQSSSIAARFEKPSYSSPSPARNSTYRSYGTSDAVKTAADLASLGPSVSSRASRFDSTVRDTKEKYRNEARELINKWTSRERPSAENSYTRKPYETTSSYLSKSNDYPYRKSSSMTPTRSTVPAVARYSSLDRGPSLMSPSPTPIMSTTPKFERPWRQRMAESSRIRAIHGDEVSASYTAARARAASSRASSRRGSLSQASGDELETSLGQLRSYLNHSGYPSRDSSVYGPTSRFSTSGYSRKEEPNKYMSRSYSPVRSPHDLFKNASSSVLATSLDRPSLDRQSRPSSRESLTRDDSKERQYVSAAPKNPTIRESSREKELDRKRTRSSKERTARRNSRQRSQQLDSSSSGEDMDVGREDSRRRRRRKKTDADGAALPPSSSSTAIVNLAAMVSSIYDTSKEDLGCHHPASGASAQPGGSTGGTCLLVNASEDDFQSCAGSLPSPAMGQKVSRSGSATKLRKTPSKTQIIKSPSVVEVPGISRSSSKASMDPLSPVGPLSPPLLSESISALAESISLNMSNSIDDLDDLCFDSEDPASSVQGDESYSAVAHFKPSYKPKVKRIAPVPGLWSPKGDEQVISKNKSLVKQEENLTTFKIWKIKKVHEKVTKRVKVPAKKKEEKKVEKKEEKKEQKITQDSPIKKLFLGKKKSTKTEDEESPMETKTKPPPKEENVSITANFMPKRISTVSSASIVLKDKRRVDLPPKKLKGIRKPIEAKTDKVISKRAIALSAQKIFKNKAKNKTAHNFKCKAARNVSTQLIKDIKARERSKGAQVIVDRPQRNVNVARVKLRCRQPAEKRISMPTQSELEKSGEDLSIEFEKARLKTFQPEEPRRSMSRDSQSRAAELLDEMRFTEPAMEWIRRDSGGQLVLPDKSILEEYVKRKRGRLERLHSEPIRDDLSVTTCDSPCPSTTSELIPACAVRVHGASPLIPVITAPSRCSTIETPTPMLDSIQTLSFNNFNSTPQGFLRNNTAKLQCSRPIAFDAPKTPFEERLQQQANAIRRASSQQSDLEMRDPSPRRGSESLSISSAFTAAMAEKAGQPRHERYAAHIPVNRGETSGRQSSASVDSTQSGALDQATKQLDQVIDQARHRHHQHRSKFKEAIDYLDQIFEDLKKECDVTGEDKNNNSEANTATVHFTPREPKKVVQPAPLKTNSLPDRAQRHNKISAPTAPSPIEVTLSKKKVSSSDSTAPEVAVTETIVLPKKTDKLDFTRRWLQDDLSSLAQQPSGPVMFSDACMYTDADEHSLGSCSAEVAAINANRKEKTKKNSTAPIPVKVPQPAPIRPQPQRLQPTYAVPGSSNGTRHFPVEFDGLQRVASFDHVHAPRENSWQRAGSQEPYQTLGSVRSEIDRPSPSAFQNVSAFSQRGNMRGSLRSLQNVDMMPIHKLTPPKDPTLAIDALVAELELNTEQPTCTADKRRSFPTSLRTEQQHEHVRRGSERHNSRGRNGYGKQTNYQDSSFPAQAQIRHNRQQRSLDEAANMLQHVVGDLGAIQRQRKPLNQQTSLNHNSLLQNPFETINQEKIGPSRVENMHNMFERGAASQSASWRSPQPYQQPVPQPYKAPKDEECYYDLADYAVKAYKRVSPPRQVQTVRQSPLTSSQEFTPAYPLTNPPSHPPGRNGSANSSTNGGYYSSNSSTAGPSHATAHPTHRSSLIGRQSLISSRGPSVDDEDDGFYDNIGVFDDRRFSRGSEMDVASISSRPPTGGNQKHNRIGSFLRKIGGSSRPPGSAASLISLNKVAQEAPIRSGNLMKSNSLSTEPWKKQVLQQSMPNQNKGGLGQRLKNSLFGSKKRLNG